MKNPVDSIKTVLRESYGIEEITKARKLLSDICDKLECRPGGITNDRKDSPQRSAVVISIDDIMDMMAALDQKNHTVIFYARNFDNTPRVVPDEVTNMVSINRRMDEMEVAVKHLQTVIETQAELVTDLTNKLTATVSVVETRVYSNVISAPTSRDEAFPALHHQTQHGQKVKMYP